MTDAVDDPTTDFVLELNYPKNIQHVERVIKVLNYIENHPKRFPLNSTDELLRSPKRSWINWLLRVIDLHGDMGLPGRSGDEVCELTGRFIAALSGKSAQGPQLIEFDLKHDFSLKIREPSFAEADLGWKTWPAGIYLANWLVKYDPSLTGPFLELGCGTGIVGIVSARLNPSERHCLTDYHPSVLTNVVTNSELNSTPNIDVQELNWDWFQDWDPSESDDPDGLPSEWVASKNSFQTIYAADVLYQFQHARSVPRVIRYLLKSEGVGFICVPVRYSHIEDTLELESQLDTFLHVVGSVNLQTPPRDVDWDWFHSTGLADLHDIRGKDDLLEHLTRPEFIDQCTPENNVLGYRLYCVQLKSTNE